MEVKIIVASMIDWVGYLESCKKLISRSPTRSLDRKGVKVGGLDSFLGSLVDFSESGNCEINERVLEHLSFTFIVSLHDALFTRLVASTGRLLTFLIADDDKNYEKIFIVSANLQNWKIALKIMQVKDLANLATEFTKTFNKLGLSPVLKTKIIEDIDKYIIEG